MTVNAMDMSAPVTRGELRLELQQVDTQLGALLARIEASEQRLIQRMEGLEQRMEQRMVGMEQRMVGMEQRMVGMEQRMGQQMVNMEQRLMAQLGVYTKASEEELTTRIAVIDEKYADLPGRVKRLEGAVALAPRPSKKR